MERGIFNYIFENLMRGSIKYVYQIFNPILINLLLIIN